MKPVFHVMGKLLAVCWLVGDEMESLGGLGRNISHKGNDPLKLCTRFITQFPMCRNTNASQKAKEVGAINLDLNSHADVLGAVIFHPRRGRCKHASRQGYVGGYIKL